MRYYYEVESIIDDNFLRYTRSATNYWYLFRIDRSFSRPIRQLRFINKRLAVLWQVLLDISSIQITKQLSFFHFDVSGTSRKGRDSCVLYLPGERHNKYISYNKPTFIQPIPLIPRLKRIMTRERTRGIAFLSFFEINTRCSSGTRPHEIT